MDQADAPGAPVGPAPTGRPAIPAAATGETRGTADPALIDLATGEEIPAGFATIDDYRLDGDWHHIDWGRDAQGGTRTYKTKLTKIGNRARVAYNDRIPVKLHAAQFPFLDKVERVDDEMSAEKIAATKWVDEIPDQGF